MSFLEVVGFVLLSARLIDPFSLRIEDRAEHASAGESLTAIELVRNDRNLLFRNQLPESYREPSESELRQFSRGIQHLLEYRDSGTAEHLQQAEKRFAELRFKLNLVEGSFAYLNEASPARGWGAYLIDLSK